MTSPKDFLLSQGIELEKTALLSCIDGYMRQPSLSDLLLQYADIRIKEQELSTGNRFSVYILSNNCEVDFLIQGLENILHLHQISHTTHPTYHQWAIMVKDITQRDYDNLIEFKNELNVAGISVSLEKVL